jgi:ATP-dependent Clp protease adaptor protein ClpS
MTKELPQQGPECASQLTSEFELILHNDDVNTFEFVIRTLMDVCDHDQLQAEQCTLITHYNGKCGVKRGSWTELKDKQQIMSDLGLMVDIT